MSGRRRRRRRRRRRKATHTRAQTSVEMSFGQII